MWTTNKIVSLMNGGKETWVILKPQVPVSINYFTAWVDNNGVLNFRKDVYGLDKELGKLYYK
ncbi:murein L,D-transpeptidase [compost metagenome]